MKQHSSALAVGLMLFVVLACNLGKRSASVPTNRTAEVEKAASNPSSSTGAISEIHMAKDDGRGDPGDQADVFNGNDRTIHCVVKLNEAKSGTKMKFSWWVVDAENTKNEKIRDIDYTTRALENVVHGHLTAPREWPTGKYKVEVFVNGNLENTVGYTVQ